MVSGAGAEADVAACWLATVSRRLDACKKLDVALINGEGEGCLG